MSRIFQFALFRLWIKPAVLSLQLQATYEESIRIVEKQNRLGDSVATILLRTAMNRLRQSLQSR